MLFSKAAIFTAAAALVGLVSAQTGVPTPEGQVKVHVVQVGDKDGNLKFYPEELEAAVGDMVQFHFYPKNHSVARSTFADPCTPLDPASANGTASFFSGFMPVQETDMFMPTFTILVNETTPIWYYCATGRHCQNGMSGVINPPKNNAERTLAKYKEAATGANTVVPGPPSGGETDPDGPDGPETPVTPDTPDNTTTTPTSTNTPPANSDSAASSFVASAATVVLGAVAVAAFLV